MCQIPYYLLKMSFLAIPSNIITPHSPICSYVSFFLFISFSLLFNLRDTQIHQISEMFCFAYSLITPHQVNLDQCELGTFCLIYRPIPNAKIAPGTVRIQYLYGDHTPANIHYSRIFWEILGLNLNHPTSELRILWVHMPISFCTVLWNWGYLKI